MDCTKTQQMTVGSTSIWQIEGQTAFFYEAGMAIDADGAPQAYHPDPDSNLGLDFLANAGSPGNWFGIVTDTGQPDGNPIIQSDTDPAPGFYVSSTSLQDTTKDRTDSLRYVDATQIPYIVLPSAVRTNLGAQLGDFAVVINSTSSQLTEAIFADIGPRGKIGEGSIALAGNLGIPSSPKHGGTDSGVIYVVFPGSGNGNPRSNDEIVSGADSAFQAMGGMAQIQACFPELAPPGTPTVTGLNPTRGSAAGGDSVVITGSGFTGATDVGFGSTNATSISVDSDTQITAVSPAGSGTVDVTVITPNGTSANSSADQFNYVDVSGGPTVTGINPTSGSVDGGDTVVITGSGFTGATDVGFGSTNATSISVDSDSQITAVSPAGSDTVDITVITPSGTSATNAADQFTYL